MNNTIDRWFALVKQGDYDAAFEVWQQMLPSPKLGKDFGPENTPCESLFALHEFCVFAGKKQCGTEKGRQDYWKLLSSIAETARLKRDIPSQSAYHIQSLHADVTRENDRFTGNT